MLAFLILTRNFKGSKRMQLYRQLSREASELVMVHVVLMKEEFNQSGTNWTFLEVIVKQGI